MNISMLKAISKALSATGTLSLAIGYAIDFYLKTKK